MSWPNGILSTLALGAAVISGCVEPTESNGPRIETVDALTVDAVVPVRVGRIESSIDLVGTLIPFRFANIVAEVDGVIRRIPRCAEALEYEIDGEKRSTELCLDLGHPVKQGDVLVEIDPTDFELRLLADQARLRLAQNELLKLMDWRRDEERDQLRAQLDEAEATLERAASEMKRTEQLRDDNVLTMSEVDQTTMVFLVAKAVKQKAEAAWAIAEAGPTEEEIAIAEARVALAEADVKMAAENLSKCTIRAPYDAIIADRYVGEGDRVTALPRVEIMQIIDPTILFAQIAVPEQYQGLISLADMATVRVAGQQVPGVVGLINQKIDPATRTFRVRVGIENFEMLFKSGSFVEVELEISSATNMLLVPRQAVTFADGQPAVFLFQPTEGSATGRIERREISLGIADETNYAVDGGLTEGEQVVLGSASLLTDGLAARLAGPDPTTTPVQLDRTTRQTTSAGAL